MDTVLERDESQEAEKTTVAESAETLKQPEAQAETEVKEEQQSEETAREPEFEIDGQRFTAAQVREFQQAYKNKTDWQKSNTQKAQELAEQRRQLQPYEQIARIVQQKPELLQKLLSGEPERDFDSDLRSHYGKRPDQYADPQGYVQWEYEKDRMIQERAAQQARQQAEKELVGRMAVTHNDQVERDALMKYGEKVTPDEFRNMAQWVVENINAKSGMYPKNSFDIAFNMLYQDRALGEAKLAAVKEVAKSQEKAKPASGVTGKLKTQETKTPEDEEDDAFVSEMKQRK